MPCLYVFTAGFPLGFSGVGRVDADKYPEFRQTHPEDDN